VRSRIQHLDKILIDTPLKSLANELERTTLIRARWIASDLLDRIGEYEHAGNCLLDYDEVKLWLHRFPNLPPEPNQRVLVRDLLWFSLLHSVAEHRKGNFESALGTAQRLQDKVEMYLRQAHQTDKQSAVRWLVELSLRFAYAHGRHLQSQGRADEAESQIGRTILFCSQAMDLICIRTDDLLKRHPGEKAKKRITEARHKLCQGIYYWTSTALIALARAFLDQGQLKRAQRQTLVARTLIRQTENKVGIAFANYLLGSICRQLGDVDSAIEYIENSILVFKAAGHERYFLRARYELAKAYFFRATAPGGSIQDYQRAKEIIDSQEPTVARFRGDPKTSARWEGATLLLKARISLGLGHHEDAERQAKECLQTLGEYSKDLRAQAHAVLAEVHLSRRSFTDATRHCLAGLDLNPVDVTDSAWLTLVLCESYTRRKHFDNARRRFDEWLSMEGQVENEFMRQRAAILKRDLDAEQDSFYIPYSQAKTLRYEEANLELRAFLVRRIRTTMRGRTQEEQAEELGISRQTYSGWLTELRRENKIDD